MGLPMSSRFSAHGTGIAMLGKNDQPHEAGRRRRAGVQQRGFSSALKRMVWTRRWQRLKIRTRVLGRLFLPALTFVLSFTRDLEGCTVQILEEA